jgi:hypothetical protein
MSDKFKRKTQVKTLRGGCFYKKFHSWPALGKHGDDVQKNMPVITYIHHWRAKETML